MAIEAELADGRILEFPDGTDPAVIQSAVKRVMGIGAATTAAPAVAPAPASTFGFGDTPATDITRAADAKLAAAAAPIPTAAPVADNLDARLAAQEAKKKEFSLGEEFGKGARSAYEYALPSMGRQLGLQGSADAMMSRKKSLDLMAKIDSGAYPSLNALKNDPTYEELRASGGDTGSVNAYFANRGQPDIAAKMRGTTEKEFQAMATDTRTHIDMLNKYAQENKKKYGPRVEKFTDINWADPQVAADFTNWLGYNMGSGAVQMAPIMLAAVVAKQPGLLATSGAMGVSEAVGNRMKAIQDRTKDLPPAQQGEAIARYVAETGDANLITGLVSGSFDLLLGPAAKTAKMVLGKSVGEIGKVAAMKKAAKELPKDIAEEAITGGLQEATQIATKKSLGEEGKRVSMENVKDIINAAAAEAAGAPVGTAVNVGMAGVKTPSGQPQVQPAPTPETRIEPTLGETKQPPSVVEAARAEKVSALAERIASRGIDPEDALRIATAQVASDEQKKQAAEEAAAEELPTYYPKEKGNRLNEIFLELVDQGIPPNKAQAMAGQQLAAEREDRKIAAAQGRNIKKAKKDAATQAPTTGAENVGQPITEAGGVSPELAGQPGQVEPTAGVGEPTAAGVVPTGQDVSQPAAREEVEPVAVTEPESKEAYAERTQGEEAAPDWNDTDARANRVAERYEQANMPEKAAQVRESLQAQRPDFESVAALEVQQDQELAPAAEEKPKGKRGRKALPPEQKAVSEARRKQQRVEFNAANRSVKKLEADLNKAAEPINEAEVDTDEQLKTLEDEKRVDKNAAVRALYALTKTNKGAPGKRAVEALKNPAITKRELADAAAAYEMQKKLGGPLANRSSQGVPDSAFAKFKNAAQALTHIVKTAKSPFEKELAERLRNAVTGVEFTVIEEGDALPPILQKPRNAAEWDRARGLFIQDGNKRYVFVRGTSFPSNEVGANNITVLHELLHAATNKKIELGILASLRGYDVDAKITKFVNELNGQMATAQMYYEYLEGKGQAPVELRRLVRSTEDIDEETGEKDYSVFSLPHEFLAYGMSDPVFQAFLNRLPSNKKNVSGFSRFVTSILDVFGLGKDKFTALSDLVNITDKLISAPKTSTMRLVERGMPSENEPSASAVLPPEEEEVKPGTLSKTAHPDIRTAKEVERDVDVAINQVAESRNAEELAKSTSVLQLATDPKALAGAARRAYDAASLESKRVLLNGTTTDFLVEMGSREIPELANTWRYVQEMHGMTARLMEGADDPSTVLFNVVKDATPEVRQQLYDVALESTLAEIDPSTDRRSKKLNARYDALPLAAQNAYKAIRDYFTDMVSLYGTILDDQINELGASAEDKANLMSKLKAIYEVGGNIVPYFSLVRRGNFWLRVAGKGKERQFYMFRTLQERDKVAEALAAKRGSTVGQLRHDADFEIGNDIQSLRLDSYDDSAPKLTAVMDAVDNIKLVEADTTGTAQQRAERILAEKNKLKDAIYQMYLMSLPDQNFRKKFISREGVTGFTTDLLQNFSDTASSMSVQLARIKYGRKIRGSLLAARKSIANRPELAPYTEEMKQRVDLELPTNYNESKITGYMDAAANFGTRTAFLYYLSGASSALLQPISVVQFAIPLLGARHGYGATMAEMGKMMKVWNAYGISRKNSDGTTTYIMPTLRNSGAVVMDPVEKRAMDQMVGRNIGQVTLAGELMARKNAPTEKVVSPTRRAAKAIWWGATGALMQTAERLSQEMVFLTSFRLSRRNAKEQFRKTKDYTGAKSTGQAMADFEKANFQRWIDQAVIDTHESLGNMTAENRPPVMRNPGGKLALQFMMFPLHNYIMLGKNASKMIGLMPAKDRAEAAKTFWGQMAMTTLLAGAVGAPGVYMMLGFLSGMWRDFWDEDKLKRPADLRELDFVTWFRQKFLPQQLGNEWAKLVDRGVLNYATNADFSSRLSLSNMFLREGKETKTEREGMAQWLTDHMGASVSQALTYADAVDAFKKGDYRTGAEKIAPAFARNWMFMAKQKAEGAKDSRGAQILSKDAISTGELVWRAVGFNSDALSELQTNNFKVVGIEQKINNERGRILDRLDLHLRNNDLKEYTKAYNDMGKFNAKYPWVAIDDIGASLEKKQEQRGMSWRGIGVTEKNAPYAVEALGTSRAGAAEKERKAAEK